MSTRDFWISHLKRSHFAVCDREYAASGARYQLEPESPDYVEATRLLQYHGHIACQTFGDWCWARDMGDLLVTWADWYALPDPGPDWTTLGNPGYMNRNPLPSGLVVSYGPRQAR